MTYSCRHCHAPLQHTVLDLGHQPPSNAYLTEAQLEEPEIYYPLKLFVCSQCWLVQVPQYASAEQLFSADYAYFSSISKSWVEHARTYVEMITKRCHLGTDSFVVELAANDGYLLQFFLAQGIPCLGIEPTTSTAAVARKKGIPVREEFFGLGLAQRMAADGEQADLIIGNNVLAHVPDINDFIVGIKTLLKPGGTVTLEFPYLMKLLQNNQFDTVYHEHFSYLSLGTVCRIFELAGLKIWDVERLHTHGGSLRIFACHQGDQRKPEDTIEAILAMEAEQKLQQLSAYQSFQYKADEIKDALLAFLIDQKRSGKSVAAYGAAAKGNTLLNYGGVKSDLLPYVCDAASSKQGKYLPGSHIPILSPSFLKQSCPDIVLILPWNIADEVKQNNADLAENGTQFFIAVPKLALVS